MPRLAFSEPSIGSTTTVYGSVALRSDLLADDAGAVARESARGSPARRPRRSRSSRRRPHRRRRPARDPRASAARRARARRRPARRGRARASQSSKRVEQQPGRQLRDRRTSTSAASSRLAWANRATCSTVTGWSRNAAAASPRSTAAIASSAYAVYVTPSGASDSTTRGPKSSSVATREIPPVAVERDAAVRGVDLLAGHVADATARGGASGRSRARVRARHEHRERVCRSGVLLAIGDGRLVAVVAVGDQERRVDRQLAGRRPATRACARRPPRRRARARRRARRAAARRRRARRSARAASASLAAAAAGPPSARRASARAAAPRRPRTA